MAINYAIGAAKMFIFTIIYIISYVIAFREVLKGNPSGMLIFLIFGLSIYTTAMSVAFLLGLKSLIPIFQVFKEILVLSVFTLTIVNLKYRPRLHLIDSLILAFFIYTLVYAILPIGDQNFVSRLLALKSTSFFVVVYFTGRLINPRTMFVNKYFNYVLLITIAAGAITVVEVAMDTYLQTFTGYADYVYYFFNIQPDGSYGLGTTFESEGGYKRFASFFTSPLEYANSTVIALSIIIALFTRDDNRFKINGIGMVGLGATIISIIFSFSRAPLVSYMLIIYIYAIITHKKIIVQSAHLILVLAVTYFVYLFTRFGNSSGIIEVIMNTIDFTNPSSISHIEQWLIGILSIVEHPLGIGLGSSGRVGATVGENIGGENQYIIIGVQAGIIALLLYLSVFILFIKTSLKWLPSLKGKERKICMAVLLIKIGLFIPLLTSEVETSSYISYMNWFLSGVFISIIMQPRESEIAAAHD